MSRKLLVMYSQFLSCWQFLRPLANQVQKRTQKVPRRVGTVP